MMPAETWAIIPVKTLRGDKQRLAPVLPAQARRELVLSMLQSVLAATVAAGGVARILVVTADPSVALLGEAKAAEVLREDRARGLNAAVRLGLARAAAAGAARALVLPADPPPVTPGELNCRLRGGSTEAGARAILGPAADGDGTNAMLLTPPAALEPAFGPGS